MRVATSCVASARGSATACARSSGERYALRDESASPSSSRTVATDSQLEVEVQVADHPPKHGELLRVLLAEVGALRAARC